MEKIAEQMRQTFLLKYGKQLDETQVDVQSLKRKLEKVLVDDLEVKRLIKESEKRMFGRIEAFEEEERLAKVRREEREEKKEEAFKKASREEEERRRKFDRMLEDFAEQKRAFEKERERFKELQIAEKARRQTEEAETKLEREAREERALNRSREKEELLREELRVMEKRFFDRIEHLEWEWREREKRWKDEYKQSVFEVI